MTLRIPFKIKEIETASFHPIVEGQIEGIALNMILDTGASRTVLDNSMVKIYNYLTLDKEEAFAAGINAQKMEVEQIKIPKLEIGDIEFEDVIVFTTDLQAVSKLYQQMAGMQIDGLLGCDFLVKHKAIVDFEKKEIILQNSL